MNRGEIPFWENMVYRLLRCGLKIMNRQAYTNSGLEWSPGPLLRIPDLISIYRNEEKSNRISPKEVWRKIRKKEKITLVDIRSRQPFLAAHIPGARNVSVREMYTEEELPFHREEKVVIICYLGVASREIVSSMKERGYFNVVDMEGGMASWKFKTEEG